MQNSCVLPNLPLFSQILGWSLNVYIGLNGNTSLLELQNVPESPESEHSILETSQKRKACLLLALTASLGG